MRLIRDKEGNLKWQFWMANGCEYRIDASDEEENVAQGWKSIDETESG